jgi:hypothetical protein
MSPLLRAGFAFSPCRSTRVFADQKNGDISVICSKVR